MLRILESIGDNGLCSLDLVAVLVISCLTQLKAEQRR